MTGHLDIEQHDSTYLSHQDFLELLREVDEILAETTDKGTAYVLYAVGGFVMGRDDQKRMTQDIDVTTAIPAPVVVAATEVAARQDMHPAWLNDHVREMVRIPVSCDQFDEMYRGRHLIVYGANDELMLALKLMSGRGRDIPDIVNLALRTTCSTADALLNAWENVYKAVPGSSLERHFVYSVITEKVIPELRRRKVTQDAVSSVDLKHSHILAAPTQTHTSVQTSDAVPVVAVICGYRLANQQTCRRRLRGAPCPHHPHSPGSKRVKG